MFIGELALAYMFYNKSLTAHTSTSYTDYNSKEAN